METALFLIEKGLLIGGILFVLTGITQYGRRSHDWKGVATMFYKRIPMTIAEYKWYRLGIAMMVCAFVLRIILLMIWPNY
ncbi:hypothetical protein [Vibrio furnissii]|uniref:hypothetical protein n=1 Tax=Vibrio furnissii TaxID=29494 RepID=UPI0001B91F9B|nr:hypothetical protein [Vibrio furnissii]EEX39976.1 hypothetical protein VFA_002510 [Vibrio furnissii CIP 102972]QDC94695.1 hypothetical protein FIU11_18425 [Vibrio furnissii]UON50134.1 hypothetical protein IUJ52_21665 [Vibrio furnissii]SUQ32368.1 Uncharacterised protein [Vibrio furnissii]